MISIYLSPSADFPVPAEQVAGLIEKYRPDATVSIKAKLQPGKAWLEALQRVVGGQLVIMPTVDMLGRATQARYLSVKETAYIDVSELLGIAHKGLGMKAHETSSFGVGELVRLVLEAGHRELVLIVGDVAVWDFGFGILSRVGVQAFGSTGQPYLPLGVTINQIGRIVENRAFGKKSPYKISIWTPDMRPLQALKTPQGQDDEQKAFSEAYHHVTQILKKVDNKALRVSGGAAGCGMGALLHVYLNAKLKSLSLEEARLGLTAKVTASGDVGIWVDPSLDEFNNDAKAFKTRVVITSKNDAQRWRDLGAQVVVSGSQLSRLDESLQNLLNLVG